MDRNTHVPRQWPLDSTMKSFLYPSRPLQQTGPPNELRQGQGRDKESESGRIDLTYDKYFTQIPNVDRWIVGQIDDAIFRRQKGQVWVE